MPGCAGLARRQIAVFLVGIMDVRFLFLAALLLGQAHAQYNPPARATRPPETVEELFPGADAAWARQQLDSLSLEEKIGQLFMVAAFTDAVQYNIPQVEKLVREQRIGGVMFMQGGPMRQVAALNRLQRSSRLPLMVGMDAEWGLGMRLDSTLSFPRNMTLGAIENDSLLYQYGRIMAGQCRALGVHVSFAPVVDVNYSARNPVINDRSFGQDRHLVARKALMLMQGMQDHGVMASAKHFPGHGDTDSDSHYTLPFIRHSRQRLDSIEVYPFSQLIHHGVQSVMVAHLYVPALDNTPNLPTTLSPRVVGRMLRDSLGFRGLVFTDAMNMGGVARYYQAGEAELMALKAGNDVLLYPRDVPKAIAYIRRAILEDSTYTQAELDAHVYRILLAKAWMGLPKNRYASYEAARAAIADPAAIALRDELYAQAVSLVKNDLLPVPIGKLNRRMAYVQIGYNRGTPFYETLKTYAPFDFFLLDRYSRRATLDSVLRVLKDYDVIVTGLFEMSRYAFRHYGITPTILTYCDSVSAWDAQSILVHFNNPYALQYLQDHRAVIAAYEEAPAAQVAAAEIVMGSRQPTGLMPVVLPDKFSMGFSYVNEGERFRTARPDEAGMDPATLDKIEPLVQDLIRKRAMPGCAIMALRNNNIVYNRAFGYHTYQREVPVDSYASLFDLASVTKVVATTVCAMKLWEEKKLTLDAPVHTYLPEVTGAVGDISIRELLQHNSGLVAWIPFYLQTVKYGVRDPAVYDTLPSASYPVQIGTQLWLNKDYPDSIWHQIIRQPVNKAQGYKYSDLNMIILKRVMERITNQSLEDYATHTFYQPLGMNNTLFNPAWKGRAADCPPTVEDRKYRFERVQGYVNDECASLLGGYSGHAGLFSNPYDLAKLLLMLRNGGEYGGERYLEPGIIRYFTSQSTQLPSSRRGLGWDKPDKRPGYISPASDYATASAYGHLGFTGTCVWVDPEADLIYILLANRTYPDSENNTFLYENVRGKVADLLYESIRNARTP